jgi:predicted nucleic acid-binding protein
MGILDRELLLDSVILIDHLNGVPAATGFLARERHRAIVSPITRAEVLAGISVGTDEATACARLLDHFPTLSIDRETADRAAAFRQQHRLKLPDALQAALATQHGLQLVTRDARDLSPERFAFVSVPYAV